MTEYEEEYVYEEEPNSLSNEQKSVCLKLFSYLAYVRKRVL